MLESWHQLNTEDELWLVLVTVCLNANTDDDTEEDAPHHNTTPNNTDNTRAAVAEDESLYWSSSLTISDI